MKRYCLLLSCVASLAFFLPVSAAPVLIECISETGEASATFWDDLASAARGQADPDRVQGYEDNARFCRSAEFGRKVTLVFDQGSDAKVEGELEYWTICGALHQTENITVTQSKREITAAYYHDASRRMRYFSVALDAGTGGFGARRDFECRQQRVERSGQLF
jgi:hypothetical protein